MPGWIRPVAYASPLTHVVELLRFGVFGRGQALSPWVSGSVVLGFLVAACAMAGPAFRRFATR
jgi:hypothetical protein